MSPFFVDLQNFARLPEEMTTYSPNWYVVNFANKNYVRICMESEERKIQKQCTSCL